MHKRLICSFGGVGLIPGMPGTYASLLAAVIFYLLWLAIGPAARIVAGVLVLGVGAIGLATWSWSRDEFKAPDARQFVLDEVAAQWLTLLFIPLEGHVMSYVAVGFFLFRGFDVAKPWPVSAIDRMAGPWGPMFDDVAAAVYSGLLFWALFHATHALVGTEVIAALG